MERPEVGANDEAFSALSSAISADAVRERVGAVELVRGELRKLPKPVEVERLAGILYQAGCDPKWEVRRAVADSLDLLPEPLAGELEQKLRADRHHDVRSAIERLDKRRKRQAREEKKLDNQSAQAAARIARLEKQHGPEVARAAQETAWELLSAVVRPVAHDLRHLLLDDGGEDESPAERKRRGKYVASLVADLADFSDPAVIEPERLVLREAVEESLEIVRRRAGAHLSARVRHEIQVDLGLTVHVPRGRLLRVLTNLITNAFDELEECDREGLVRFACETTDRRRTAVLRIADTGRGIPKEELERIWLPGVTTKRPRLGKRHTGWGLAIARRFVERDCHGKAAVDSTVGVGTTFILELPIVRKGAES